MTWRAELDLCFENHAGRTVARHLHTGPLRVLQSLYPEGPAICHNVLIHPPGGLVGGDTLALNVRVQSGAHGLVTTPGATRFYRSDALPALQSTHIALDADARLEWLPLETLCYSGCQAENHVLMQLAPSAELLGWDVCALGLPAAKLPFLQGQVMQHLALADVWLERGLIAAHDALLRDSSLGLAGHSCLGTLFFAAGSAIARPRKAAALALAQDIAQAHQLQRCIGVTSPNPQVLVLRVLSPVVEPVMDLFRQVRAAWRRELWALSAQHAPRVWGT
jgi:urease accessory protein